MATSQNFKFLKTYEQYSLLLKLKTFGIHCFFVIVTPEIIQFIILRDELEYTDTCSLIIRASSCLGTKFIH